MKNRAAEMRHGFFMRHFYSIQAHAPTLPMSAQLVMIEHFLNCVFWRQYHLFQNFEVVLFAIAWNDDICRLQNGSRSS